MFETLPLAPPDAILGLTEAFKSDPHPEKINLTIGVFQDAEGRTPILECVKEAERRLLQDEKNKSYLGIAGLPGYGMQVRDLLFGPDHEIIASGRAATVQTPGGTGALRVAGDFLHRFFPQSKVWLSTPTWANHKNVFAAAGVETATYPYLNAARTGLDFDAMMEGLKTISPGDVVLLHACCHNPTGVDPTLDQWRQIADVVTERRLLPLVDFAYQGFGSGFEADAQGFRQLCRTGCELLVCTSFSKNFGLYGERVGALTVVTAAGETTDAALSQLKACVRSNYSNPPKHGAAIVSEVLGDAALREKWEAEVAAMRERIHTMRTLFAEKMKEKGAPRDFSFVTEQQGMFSYTGLTRVQVDELRTKHSIYLVGDGRMNVASITEANVDHLCNCIAAVLA